MARRGGKAFGTKFSFDLAALGFGGRFGLSQLTSAQQPPSSFPPLDAQPAKLTNDNEHEYLVELSRNFHSLVNDSPFYLRPLKAPKSSVERYPDMLAAQSEKATKAKSKSWPPLEQWPIDWNRFPMEIRPASLRPGSADLVSPVGKEKKKISRADDSEAGAPTQKKRRLRVKDEEVDDETIQKRLAALEQLEQQPGGENEEGRLLTTTSIKQELLEIEHADEEGAAAEKKASSDNEEADEASGDDEAAQEEDFDEEMGDYGDTYFDNGEAFEDDDDNDNEGPTY